MLRNTYRTLSGGTSMYQIQGFILSTSALGEGQTNTQTLSSFTNMATIISVIELQCQICTHIGILSNIILELFIY